MGDEEAKWKRLWERNAIDGCKLPDLKAFLKKVGLPMNGEVCIIYLIYIP